MRSALRSIDRYLVCQVIQVLLEPIVEDYIARWLHAMDEGDTPPGPLELVEAATDNGIPILAYHPVRAYLFLDNHIVDPYSQIADLKGLRTSFDILKDEGVDFIASPPALPSLPVMV